MFRASLFCLFLSLSAFSYGAEEGSRELTKNEILAAHKKASIYQKLNDFESAIYFYKISAASGYVLSEYYLGFSYLKLGQYEQATPWLTKVALTTPKNFKEERVVSLARYKLGLLSYSAGDKEEALRWYITSVQYGDLIQFFALGTLYYEMGEYEKAIVWLDKASAENHQGVQKYLQSSRQQIASSSQSN